MQISDLVGGHAAAKDYTTPAPVTVKGIDKNDTVLSILNSSGVRKWVNYLPGIHRADVLC